MMSPPSESLNSGVGGMSTDRKVNGLVVVTRVHPSSSTVSLRISLPIASIPSVHGWRGVISGE